MGCYRENQLSLSQIQYRESRHLEFLRHITRVVDVMLTVSQCMEIQTTAIKDVSEIQSDTNISDKHDRSEK